VIIAVISENNLLISVMIICSLLSVMLTNKDNHNILHLCLGFLIVKTLDMLILGNISKSSDETISSMWVNLTIFSIHLIVDIVLFVFVLFRAPLSRLILLAKNKSVEHIFMCQSEVAFMSLFIVFMLVDLAAIIENFMRHLDEMGFAIETAETFSSWTWIFYHYSDIKSLLTGMSFILIWTMIFSAGQQKFNRNI